ncbi:QueT transporter family protein [Thermoproteota archaeon]
MNTKEISLTAVIAALYATIVIFLAPISFGPIQLRVADGLIPLAALLGLPAVYGVALGALVANTYWFMSPIDIILGAIANLVAGYLIYKYRDRLILASIAASLVIGVIVGGYLWLFFPPPSILGFHLPAWLGMIISITFSSVLAIVVIGLTLIKFLENSGYLDHLKA